MNFQEIHELLKKHDTIDEEDTASLETYWEDLSNLLASDLDSALSFLKSECTEAEIVWISEVFDELVQKTQSQPLIKALRETIARFRQADNEYRLAASLNIAVESFLQ